VYFKFNSSVTSAENSEHSVHTLAGKRDLNVDQVKEQILENTRITVREAASLMVNSSGPIQSIL
jgi:hypothetical protein